MSVHRVVTEPFRLHLGRRCRCWKKAILQFVKAGHQKGCEAAQVRKNYLHVRKTPGNFRLHQLQQANRVFKGRADGPGEFAGLDHLRAGVVPDRMQEQYVLAAIQFFPKSDRKPRRQCFCRGHWCRQ